MRRISLAVALLSAVTAGCAGGGKSTDAGGARGTPGSSFTVVVNPVGVGVGSTVPGGRISSASIGDPTATAINCGSANGTSGSTCASDFKWDSGDVVLTATIDTANDYVAVMWAGACNGQGVTCTLTGNSEKKVYVRFYRAGEQLVHPNYSDPLVHRAAFGSQTLVCTNCHGGRLQGVGNAVGCGTVNGCHTPAEVDAMAEHIPQPPPPPGTAPAGAKETCATCHAGTSAITAAHANNVEHDAANAVLVSVSSVTQAAGVAGTLEFTMTVSKNGFPSNAFTTTYRAYRFAADATRVGTTTVVTVNKNAFTDVPVLNAFTRTQLTSSEFKVSAPVNGAYKVTMPGMLAKVSGTPTTFMVLLNDGVNGPSRLYATGTVNYGTGAPRDLVGDDACKACHGEYVFRHREEGSATGEIHHNANPAGVTACIVCHTRADSTSRFAGGDRLTAYVHGIHNSYAMKGRSITGIVDVPTTVAAGGTTQVTVAVPAKTYARNDGLVWNTTTNAPELSSAFSKGFPSYILNCRNCHNSDARVAALDTKPVNYSTCMSCHDSWAGFKFTNLASEKTTHASYTYTTDCTDCHYSGASTAKDVYSEFHNGLKTGRSGVIWGGKDASVTEGAKVVMTIASIETVANSTDLSVKWTATYDGSAVDPCNQTATVAKPVVFYGATANAATGQAASNLSILRVYAQGNDWLGGPGSSPGQPGSSVNVTTTNTSCIGNEATTVVAGEVVPTFGTMDSQATRAAVAIQGKAQVRFTAAVGTSWEVIQTRSKSPVKEYVPPTCDWNASPPTCGTSAVVLPAPDTLRRQVVDIAKCNRCHEGSVYQHGGNRIDSIELCVMCHNPAAGEKNTRYGTGTAGYGYTDATYTQTYDGKKHETIDMRYMIHAIHSAGATSTPLVYYRTSGVFLFGNEETFAWLKANKGYPGAGSAATPPGAAGVPGSWNNYKHNEVIVHYPRGLNECLACHIDNAEFKTFPNQATKMALTTDPASVADAAAIRNQVDDVLMGASAASCLSCHQSLDAALNTQLKNHAFGYGWTPQAFTTGRTTIINNAAP